MQLEAKCGIIEYGAMLQTSAIKSQYFIGVSTVNKSTENSFQLPLPNFGDERRKYFIYRILNTVNDMSYIGITVHASNRKSSHFSLLKQGNHFNNHLQRAYHKYGSEAFSWEIIERLFCIETEAYEREKYWISQFGSYGDGYNQNIGGVGRYANPVIWNGIWYSSAPEIASILGITESAMYLRLRMGYTCDEDMPGSYCRVVIWNGITYPSITDAAKALGISEGAIAGRLRRGETCDEDVLSLKKPCEWNGKTYSSIKEAATELGITSSCLVYRFARGYTSDADLNK